MMDSNERRDALTKCLFVFHRSDGRGSENGGGKGLMWGEGQVRPCLVDIRREGSREKMNKTRWSHCLDNV